MPTHLLTPIYRIDLGTLRAAGRFASPDGDGDGGGAGEGNGGDGAGEGAKEGGGDKGSSPASRIAALVEERNAERAKAAQLQQRIDALTQQVEQLKGGEKAVADLQKKLEEMQSATATRFDKLLETELANLPDDAAALVQSVPGSSEAKFDFLVANRARLVKAEAKEQPKPAGAANEKKPNGDSGAGVSSVVKAAVEARKAKPNGFAGLTG